MARDPVAEFSFLTKLEPVDTDVHGVVLLLLLVSGGISDGMTLLCDSTRELRENRTEGLSSGVVTTG